MKLARSLFNYRSVVRGEPEPIAVTFWKGVFARAGTDAATWLRSRGWAEGHPNWWGIPGVYGPIDTLFTAVRAELNTVAVSYLRSHDPGWQYAGGSGADDKAPVEHMRAHVHLVFAVWLGRARTECSLKRAFERQLDTDGLTIDTWFARVLAGEIARIVTTKDGAA